MSLAKTKFKSFGQHLRTLREVKSLPLREVASNIGIDPSLLAKIERNERQPSKRLVKKISKYFMVNEKDLLDEILSDQIAYIILDEEAGLNVLKVAEKKINYLKRKNNE